MLVGQIFGQYELRDYLGEGGMGAVYRGFQVNLKREVAVKVLSGELAHDSQFIARFNREAQTIAALEHPNIVPIHDFGTQQGVSYVVMRMLDGGTLEDRLEERHQGDGALPSMKETARLLQQIAGALDYAHEAGIIHRDIKPSNIMFDRHGIPFLLDFGIAKLLSETTSLTQTGGGSLGTPIYMAPEQWLSETITPQTDQYALGVVIYIMVAGQRPFNADTAYGLLHQHLNETPPPVHEVRPGIPPAVSEVIGRALAKKPQDRYPNATAFAEAFAEAIGGINETETNFFTFTLPKRTKVSPVTSAAGLTYVQRKPFHKSPVAWVMLLAVALLAVLIGLMLASGDDEGDDNGEEVQALQQTLTEVAAIAAEDTQAVVNQTATATLWTQTPTQTETATITPSATTTPTSIATQTDAVTETATATNTATTTPTLVPTDEPTDTPQPTNTASPTPEPSDTPVPATDTPTIPPEPTVLYPDGQRLELIYNEVGFYIRNPGERRVPVGSFVFEVLNSDDTPANRFEGDVWTQFSTFLFGDWCVRVEIPAAGRPRRPAQCGDAYNASITLTLTDDRIFWIPREDQTQFRVLWAGEEIARCDMMAGRCEIFLPN